MRIGPAHHQRRCVLHHALGAVGVQIEADDHRQVRPDLLAQPFQQFALAVLMLLRHHRAVEVEVDAVDLAERSDALEQLPDDLLVGVGLDLRRWRSGAPQRRQQVVALLARLRQEAGDRQIDALKRRQHGIAAREAGPAIRHLEIAEARLHRRESVGLVLEPADREARHEPSYPWIGRLDTRSGLAPEAGKCTALTLPMATTAPATASPRSPSRAAWRNPSTMALQCAGSMAAAAARSGRIST